MSRRRVLIMKLGLLCFGAKRTNQHVETIDDLLVLISELNHPSFFRKSSMFCIFQSYSIWLPVSVYLAISRKTNIIRYKKNINLVITWGEVTRLSFQCVQYISLITITLKKCNLEVISSAYMLWSMNPRLAAHYKYNTICGHSVATLLGDTLPLPLHQSFKRRINEGSRRFQCLLVLSHLRHY